MKKNLIALSIFIGLAFCLPKVHSQGYISKSSYVGGQFQDSYTLSVIDNGFTYMVGATSSDNIPKTIGSAINTVGNVPPGTVYKDLYVAKYDANQTLVWGRYLGANNYDYPTSIVVDNGEVFISSTVLATGFPVTNGTTYSGTSGTTTNIIYSKLNATNGALDFATYLNLGANTTGGKTPTLQVSGGNVYIVSNYGSGTTGQVRVTKYDATTNALLFDNTFGGNDYVSVYPYNSGTAENLSNSSFKVVGNNIYISADTKATNFPVTDGSTLPAGQEGLLYINLNAGTGAISYASYNLVTVSGAGVSPLKTNVLNDNNNIIIANTSINYGLKNTTGSFINKGFFAFNGYISVYDANTNLLKFATYLPGINSPLFANSFSGLTNIVAQASNGVIYVAATVNGAGAVMPVTTGPTTISGSSDLLLMKMNENTGAIISSMLLGGTADDDVMDMKVLNGDMYILGLTNTPGGVPVTNGSVYNGSNNDYFVTKINSNNTICFSTYLGTNGNEDGQAASLNLANGIVYITGAVYGDNYPVTNSSTYKAVVANGYSNYVITQLILDPTFTPNADVTAPATQTICKNGLAGVISAPDVTFPSGLTPKLYRLGVASNQVLPNLVYQWQVSNTSTGPWTNIAGAEKPNYTPQVGTVAQYYRRLAYTSPCASTPISTSTVAEVLVNGNFAPTVSGGGPFNTCSGLSITTIGGSPTATGTSPFTYSWTPTTGLSNATIANPVATIAATDIYTVWVTDANGCKQIGQSLINVNAANAGPTVSNCAGVGVLIGATPIAGVSGISYSWSPTTNLSCTTCAQPLASPSVAKTYTLTMTSPRSPNLTCTTTSTVTVTPIAAPTTANFAGPDRVTCLGTTVGLGTTAESGFAYTWAPGLYLPDNTQSTATYTTGNLEMPNPNPLTYTLTAAKSGCTFMDQVVATSIEANAGPDGCGPRSVGMPDRTPNVNETYTWTKMSGSGNIISGANLPQAIVSASPTTATTYQLTVTYNGTTCTDQVVVPACGCSMTLDVSAPHKCAKFDAILNPVLITATSNFSPNVTYTWTTTGGVTLSNYNGVSVNLTNTANGTVIVTATSILDGSTCTTSMPVNTPAMSFPTFSSPSVSACPGVATTIGGTSVGSYTYSWTPSTGLNNTAVSSPTATVNSTTIYAVLVTDAGTGCTSTVPDTIKIGNFPLNPAGADVTICGANAALPLGVSPVAGLTYSWTPPSPITTAGSSPTLANPVATVAATTTFTLVVTDVASGCTITDPVVVTVNSAVAPFTLTPPANYCPSSGAVTLPSGPAGMTSYAWSPSALVASPTAQTTATKNPAPSSATTFTLTVKNASGCSGSQTVTITPTQPAPDPGQNQSICLYQTAQLGGASVGGTYAWSPTTNLSSSTISNPVFTPTVAGTFTYTVTRTNAGCNTVATVTVVVNSFTIPAATAANACQNACVQLGTAATPGLTYTWSPSTYLSSTAISNPIACVGTSSQNYVLTATDANGCVASQNVAVNVGTLPAPTVTLPSISTCAGASTVTLNPTVSPSGTYTYNWTPNNATLSNVNVSNPVVTFTGFGTSTYNLVVTNSAGCSNSATASVTFTDCNVASLGDYVWYDNNGNGIQDVTEWGVPNIKVYLLNNVGVKIDSTTTNGVGYYQFGNLIPSTYSVQFVAPAGMLFSLQTQGADGAKDSNPNQTTGITAPLTLAPGQNNPNIDAGIVPVGSVGNYVWSDINHNGTNDEPASAGINGVTVQLWNASTNTLVATTTTANNASGNPGYYNFIVTTTGSYYVHFPTSNGASTSLTTATSTAATDNNSDADTSTGNSPTFTITVNGTGIAKDNTTIDAGYYTCPTGCTSISVIKH